LGYCGIGLSALPALFIPFKCLVAICNNEEVTIRKKELKELVTSLLTTAFLVGQLLLPPLYLVRRGFEFVKSTIELFQICHRRHCLQKRLIPLRQEFNVTAEVLERKIQKLEGRQKELDAKKAELKAHVLQDATGGENATEMAEKLAWSRKLTIETQDLANRVTRLKGKVRALHDEKQKLANKINAIEHKLETKYSRTSVVKKVLSVSGSALALAGGCVALLCANPITGPVVGAALVFAACAIFAGLLIHKVYETYQARAGARLGSAKSAIIAHPTE
jgi:chaperonin cofactor prefoldin